jgi:hypothetical protein
VLRVIAQGERKMPVLQLRNHIPISAPARREVADGTESDMRVSLGFEPAWFHRRCDVDFVERWHTDPYYRHDTLVRMKEELCGTFPSVTYWNLDYEDDLWTLSGCLGAYVIPWILGCSLRYAPDRWPVIAPGSTLSLQDRERLSVDALLSGAPVEELFRQMDIIESESGKIHGYLNWQGVLNNALHLRGQSIFLDMVDNPDLVHNLFSLICDVMIALAQRVQERQRRSGFYVNHFCVSNCVVNMISPESYREFVFPYDKRIAESFERFGVHTCNWNVTPYLEELRKLPRVGYLDMGMMSDMEKAKTLFPKARRAVLYSPVKLQEAPIEEIQKDMGTIYEELSPCDLVMADVQATTPDSRVNELLQICYTLEGRGN